MASFTPFKRSVYDTVSDRVLVMDPSIDDDGNVYVGVIESPDFSPVTGTENATIRMFKSTDPETQAFQEVGTSITVEFTDLFTLRESIGYSTDGKIHLLVQWAHDTQFTNPRLFYYRFDKATETWDIQQTQLQEDYDSHDGSSLPATMAWRNTASEQLVVIYPNDDGAANKSWVMRTKSTSGAFSGETSLGINKSGSPGSLTRDVIAVGPYNAIYFQLESRDTNDPEVYTIFTDNAITGPVTYTGSGFQNRGRSVGYVDIGNDIWRAYWGKENGNLKGNPTGETFIFDVIEGTLDRSGEWVKGSPDTFPESTDGVNGEFFLGIGNDVHSLGINANAILYRRNTLDQLWSDTLTLTTDTRELTHLIETDGNDRLGIGVAFRTNDSTEAYYMEIPRDLTVSYGIKDLSGIGSSEAFGNHAGCAGICPLGIPSEEAFPVIYSIIFQDSDVSLAGLGIPSGEAFDPTFRFPLVYRFGDPIQPFSVPPEETFGAHTIQFPTFYPIGIPSAEEFGTNHGIGTFDPNGLTYIYHLDDRVVGGVVKFPTGNA